MSAAEEARGLLERHTRDFNHVYAILTDSAERPRIAGPLDGVPFGVKDLYDIAGRVTASGAEPDGAPAREDAEAVALLRRAGATPVALTAMDAFAHGFVTINDVHGVCRNPRDARRIAGGSSGGSAAAVALGDVPVALGSDTNGSVRVPASLCGVYGIKPTFDAVSTRGMQAFARSLDHVGWFTTTADDAGHVLDALGVAAPASLESSRIGAPDLDAFLAPSARAARSATMAALGAASIRPLPDLQATLDASLIITAVEGADEHHDRLLSAPGSLGRSARIGLSAGARLPAPAFVAAQRWRSRMREEYERIFDDVDVLLLPTTPDVAPLIEDDTIRVGDARQPREPYLGILTIPFSLIGYPAISVPVLTGGLPHGVQLVGRPGSERTLLTVARRLEREIGVFGPMVAR